MKTNLSFLAIALLGLSACSSPTSESVSDDAANATLAKHVVGVRSLSTDAAYDKPCHFLGEELVREAFKTGEVEMTEHDLANGCAYEWAGNQVSLTFGGPRPFSSTYQAEYSFNKQFGTAALAVAETLAEEDTTATAAEDSTVAKPAVAPAVAHTTHQPAPAAAMAGAGSFEPVAELGDKAVWDPATGAMHVLYSNHIVNVQVGGKEKAEVRKERAKEMAELILEKVTHGEAMM